MNSAGDRYVLEYQLVDTSLGLCEILIGHIGTIEVDRALLLTEVEPDRSSPVQIYEYAREEVLAGMLLHVIEPPLPIDMSLDFRTDLDHSGDEVTHPPPVLAHRENLFAAEVSPVIRLTARLGIEERPVEIDGGSLPGGRFDLPDRRREIDRVRIGEVCAFLEVYSSSPPRRDATGISGRTDIRLDRQPLS